MNVSSILSLILGWSIFFGITLATSEDHTPFTKSTFSGSDSNKEETYSDETKWGPIHGWGLSLVSWIFSIILLIINIFILKSSKNNYTPIK